MSNKVFMVVIAMLAATVAAGARVIRMEGKIGNAYPIVMELEEEAPGVFSGRYAYSKTLQRSGDVACSWLYIAPDENDPYSRWTVKDCHGKAVEWWYDVRYTGGATLSACMRNARGKHYDVTAGTTEAAHESLTPYYRQHLGEYVSEFSMWDDPRVNARLSAMMGIMNFLYLKEIYQVEHPVEYHKGMFWSSGFVAHQCCDPAALWAYDTSKNSFYVWIRKDDRDYWWSETGEVPVEFQWFVQEQF
ncbi:MAG: hypothetical protein K2L21_04525 [Muribaculaceae bacterium]|nr:hypothetical protein [Muribaculaceae bacterium]